MGAIARIVITIALWLICIRLVFLDFHRTTVFDFSGPLLFLLASVVSFVSLLVDYQSFRRSRKLVSFIPTAVSILCITGLVVTKRYFQQQDNTPIVLQATPSELFSSISLDFRENGTYKCARSRGLFKGSDYLRGQYTIRDSLIILDRANLFDLVMTDRLRLVTVPGNKEARKSLLLEIIGTSKPDTLPKTYLYQVDDKGDMVPSAISFRVRYGYP